MKSNVLMGRRVPDSKLCNMPDLRWVKAYGGVGWSWGIILDNLFEIILEQRPE